MDLAATEEIRNQYIEALAEDSRYADVFKALVRKDKHEPIANFRSLNSEEPPDFLDESRQLQEILLDISAINSGVIEMKDYVQNIIDRVDGAVADIKSVLRKEEDRLQDINMICAEDGEFNMVLALKPENFNSNAGFEIAGDNAMGAQLVSIYETDYEIADISGNGIEGNQYVFEDGRYQKEIEDYSDREFIKDASDITFYEYERLVTTEKSEVRDGIINYDNKPCECVMVLAAEQEVCRMRLVSETRDIVLKQLEITTDGITWQKVLNKEIKINSNAEMYKDSAYIYGSGIICFPYTKHIRLTLSSDEKIDSTIKVDRPMPETRRKRLRINNIKLFSAAYEDTEIVSDNALQEGSVDKAALFVSEYIPEHFTEMDSISYYLIINGNEYEVQPVNSGREGTRIIKYSEVVNSYSTVSYVKLVDETIKSAKVRIVIRSHNGRETPYISNVKLCLAKDTGSIYVDEQ